MTNLRIPLFVSLEGKRVVVFGGGHVGTRRAKKFLKAGAKVIVVAKEVNEELEELSGEGKLKILKNEIDENLIDEILKDTFLVVIATSN